MYLKPYKLHEIPQCLLLKSQIWIKSIALCSQMKEITLPFLIKLMKHSQSSRKDQSLIPMPRSQACLVLSGPIRFSMFSNLTEPIHDPAWTTRDTRLISLRCHTQRACIASRIRIWWKKITILKSKTTKISNMRKKKMMTSWLISRSKTLKTLETWRCPILKEDMLWSQWPHRPT